MRPRACPGLAMIGVAATGALLGVGGCKSDSPVSAASRPSAAPKISVVAAENFFGDIAQQIGGEHADVVSIMSDPNLDPHEYEADPKDAVAIAKAGLVIQNGDDYDTWMPKLLSASPNASRMVITAADIATGKLEENPHVWYSLPSIRVIAGAMAKDFEKLDAADSAEFEANLKKFDESLAPIQGEMDSIAAHFAGTPVGLTETIFLYQTGPMKLNVLTPWAFQHAIAEGNDPPVAAIATANEQVSRHQIKVLIYNVQTVTDTTTRLLTGAKSVGIPVVGVSETMPASETYQSWMLNQLQLLESALKGAPQ